MRTRIITALAGIPVVLALLFWPGGLPWAAGLAVVTAAATWEYTTALAKQGISVHWMAMGLYAAALLLQATPLGNPALGLPTYPMVSTPVNFLLVYQPDNWAFGPLLAIMALLAGDLFWRRRSPVRNIGATLLGVAWIGALFPYLARLRFAPGGQWCVLSVLIVIWSGDSAAYFTGRALGRHKCAPAISPNKTWEGVVGGLAASALAGALMLGLAQHRPALGLLFGLLVGAAGQLGDLVESALKREIGVKDFGAILPGHGGVLDRFDSLLFAAPTAWLILKATGLA